jgi:hypothetical protein
MNHRVLCVSSLLVLASACGGRSTELLDGDSPGATIAVGRIPLRGSLPFCGPSTAGAVYYVMPEAQLVYCDGNSHQDVELRYDSTWLVAAGATASCAHAGSMLSAGPDKNGNGKLDEQEIVASAAVCNGAPDAQGAGGAPGVRGAPGSAGSGGGQGTSGAAGTAAVTPHATRPTGEGQPCASEADCAGFEASFCEIYVSRTCLVSGCSLSPDSCPAGEECCDVTAVGLVGLPTLCLAAGLCAN